MIKFVTASDLFLETLSSNLLTKTTSLLNFYFEPVNQFKYRGALERDVQEQM